VVGDGGHVLHRCSCIVTSFHLFLDVAIVRHLALHAMQHAVFLVMWTPEVLVGSRTIFDGVLLLLKLPHGSGSTRLLVCLGHGFGPIRLFSVVLVHCVLGDRLGHVFVDAISDHLHEHGLAIGIRCEIEFGDSGLLGSYS
jgi:hypothetical protein